MTLVSTEATAEALPNTAATVRPRARALSFHDLTAPLLVEETSGARILRRTSLLLAGSLLALIGWASVAQVHEVSAASGMVVPAGFERIVQHFEGGIVEEILVRAGDPVEYGQPLFILDDATTAEDLQVAIERKADLEGELESLSAIVENRPPDFTRFTPAAAMRAAADYTARQDALDHERQLIESRIEQARAMLSGFDAELSALDDDRQFAFDNFKRVESLVARGFATRALLAERKKAITDVDNKVRLTREKQVAAAERLNEARKSLAAFRARTRDALSGDVRDLRTELTAMAGNLSRTARRAERLTVTSPVNGLVKSLDVTTIGGVVSRGQPLATIVPLGEELTAETKIRVSEIGHIRVGLPVHVKVSAFDFTRFGWIEGEVSEISPSSFAEEREEPYYKVGITLSTDHLPQVPSARLSPGMAVDADIITGERTVLSYILSPISRAMGRAFAER